MRNKVGKLAEEIVSQWLTVQGWQILHQRWHCRYGEIDIIARSLTEDIIIFVEVKTRGDRNWDQNGLLAINERKQAKLILAGEIFLSEYPQYSDFNCRFDVTLLKHRPLKSSDGNQQLELTTQLQQTIYYQGYQFTIVSYIENAFC